MGATSRYLWLAAALSAACESEAPPAPAAASPSPPPDPPQSSSGDAREPAPQLTTLARAATRCSECHGEITEQWRESAHARAANGELYLAMVRDLGGTAAEQQCDRCHRPLAVAVDPELPVVAEGVTCDVCHSMKGVEIGESEASFTLSLAENIKFGPYCDARDHYFHKMGCSPIHTKSDICAGCHLWDRTEGDHTIPVFTEYREWKQGGEADAFECQDCHMEAVPGEVAAGWDPRPHVNHHGLLGGKGTLRQQALDLDAKARIQGEALVVTVTVKNTGAAHFVPTGLPERRVAVRVRVLAGDGTLVEEKVQELGRRLVDAEGHTVPFYRAVREESDTRVAPGSSRELEFQLPKISAGTIEIAASHLRLASEVASQLGVIAPQTELVAGSIAIASGRLKAFTSSKKSP